MKKTTTFWSRKDYLALSIIFLVIITGILWRVGSSADLIPPDLQYPVIEVKPTYADMLLPRVELAGAKNEYLFLRCRFPGADPASFKIKLVQAARQPTIPKINVAFYQVCWAPPTSMEKLPPDALLPFEQGLLPTGTHLEILVAFHISPDFPKGFCRYELFASDKNQSYRQPLRLRVFNFTLPEDLPITIFGGFWNYRPDHYAQYGVDSFDKYLKVIKSYYSSMRQYKINTLGGAYFFPFEELHPGKNIEDFQDYHQLVDYALNHLKYRFFQIPSLRGWRTINQPGGDFLARANVFYPLYQEYLKRHGWQDRALNYLIDEPKPELYAAVQQAYATAKNLAPAIKTLCAGWNPASEFVKVIDLWATPASYYRESQANAARSQGQEQWLYANRLHGIDHPLVHQRLIGWLLYRYQFNGYLLWGLNFGPNDPWTTEPGTADYMRRGTFYYPHPQTGLPVPTLRLESLRRGLQDYQYWQLLAEARRKGLVANKTFDQLEQRMQAITKDFQGSAFQVPMQELESLRLQIGELLDKLGHRLGEDPQKVPSPSVIGNPPPKPNIFQKFWDYILDRK